MKPKKKKAPPKRAVAKKKKPSTKKKKFRTPTFKEQVLDYLSGLETLVLDISDRLRDPVFEKSDEGTGEAVKGEASGD